MPHCSVLRTWSRRSTRTKTHRAGFQTIMMEMLAYSRPGMIEVLSALPPELSTVRASMSQAKLMVTAVRKTESHTGCPAGIETISARACVLAGNSPGRPGQRLCTLARRQAGHVPPEARPPQADRLGLSGVRRIRHSARCFFCRDIDKLLRQAGHCGVKSLTLVPSEYCVQE